MTEREMVTTALKLVLLIGVGSLLSFIYSKTGSDLDLFLSAFVFILAVAHLVRLIAGTVQLFKKDGKDD